MDIQNAYNEWSQTYDSDENRTRDLDQQLTRDLLGVRRFDAILELGCGTGKNTVFLAEIGKTVQAVDFSQGMIEKARAKVQAPHVRFAMMDISQPWDVQRGAFDLIVCNLVLEHIQDLNFIFSQAALALRANGQFFLNELHPFRQYGGKKARFSRNEETVEVEAFVHHVSDFFSAATSSGLVLERLEEYWHASDQNKLPRILSMTFQKR